jgi:predicted PurR-regulated permease PerM
MLLAGTLTYVLYNRASAFADEFPSYAHRIRQAVAPLVSKFERFEKNAESITPLVQGSKRANEVTVRGTPTNWPSFLVRGVGSISGVLIMGGVLPFLVFFMLVTKDQMNVRLVNMFESRIDVPKFVSSLGDMIRGFVLGNLIIGSIMAVGTSVVFLLLGMKGAVTLGIVSAFLNLIPFLGVLLATAVPLACLTEQPLCAGEHWIIASLMHGETTPARKFACSRLLLVVDQCVLHVRPFAFSGLGRGSVFPSWTPYSA